MASSAKHKCVIPSLYPPLPGGRFSGSGIALFYRSSEVIPSLCLSRSVHPPLPTSMLAVAGVFSSLCVAPGFLCLYICSILWVIGSRLLRPCVHRHSLLLPARFPGLPGTKRLRFEIKVASQLLGVPMLIHVTIALWDWLGGKIVGIIYTMRMCVG